jgi:hypothetical protein
MRPAIAFSWLSALTTLLGCDPVRVVQGRVQTAPLTCPAAEPAERHPVADAAVSLRCLLGDPFPLGKTDAQGYFYYANVGLWSEDCLIRVEKTGYAPQSFYVDELCALPDIFGGNECHLLTIYAELLPAAGPARP